MWFRITTTTNSKQSRHWNRFFFKTLDLLFYDRWLPTSDLPIKRFHSSVDSFVLKQKLHWKIFFLIKSKRCIQVFFANWTESLGERGWKSIDNCSREKKRDERKKKWAKKTEHESNNNFSSFILAHFAFFFASALACHFYDWIYIVYRRKRANITTYF